jgi:hypothetical protein
VLRAVVVVAAIEAQVGAEPMLPPATLRPRLILVLRQTVPLPRAVEPPGVEQAEEVAEAADGAAGARLPNLLFLKPLKLH